MKKKILNHSQSNKGFSVFTVIISIAFVGIMAMLVLYISMANFNMKVTDLKAKDSFYTAENALDEIRTGLQTEIGEAMSDAYVEVLENYTDEDSGNVESLDTIRQKAFQDKYLENLRKRITDDSNSDYYSMAKIRSYVDLDEQLDLSKESLKIVTPQGKAPELTKGGTETGLLMKNLKVIYVDPKGRASVIETDIRLGMPKVQFPTPSTLPDLMNMIVVANKGMVFGEKDNVAESNSSPITVKGNIYAGQTIGANGVVLDPTGIDVLPGQKVMIEGGERLVTLGELRVGDRAEFHNNSSTDLWAQGINVTSGTVELTGKTYLADDLTMNTTTNSSIGSDVRISGEFYGYGSPDSAKGSYFGNNKYNGWTNTALSSSIIVNGKGSNLDLSTVSRLMLAGNSYVGSSKVAGNMNGQTNTADILTGESLTVKSNQLAYLVPSECFIDEKHTNPMDSETYLQTEFGAGEVDTLFDKNKKISVWGGKSMNELGLHSTEPVQKVFYNSAGGTYVYFYLNFASPEKASEYFQNFYNDTKIKSNMDKYLNFYIGEGKGINMKDSGAFLRFVTKGNVLTYDGGNGRNGKGSLTAATDANPASAQVQEQINYQNMWYALTRKMITSYDLLKEDVQKDKVHHHNEKDGNRFVYENLVDEEALREFLAEQGKTGGDYEFTVTSAGEVLTAHVVDNENSGAFVIDSAKAAHTRLVVATGDVVIEKGVAFSGIIMAKGVLTMKPGSSLSSAPLEAAKVFQAQRDSNQAAPMDFFWEGDKYILGNAIIDNSDENNKENGQDTYDLADCITYEKWTKK